MRENGDLERRKEESGGKSWGKGERGMEKVRRGDGLGRN